MLEDRLSRTIALLGKEQALKLMNTSVMVIGLGAVGGYALEMIARLGFGEIFVVDFDCFEDSNINRQILATIDTIGHKKCEVAKCRVEVINPDAKVWALDEKISDNNLNFILDKKPMFVIDAIDDVKAKSCLIEFLVNNDICFVSAMGAGLKTKPEKLKLATLDKTQGCNLAKKMRDELRKKNVDLRKVNCVFSDECVQICKDENGNNVLGSLPIVPCCMGTMLANFVLEKCK
jgi:tRNA A37 threonylcarbamoyladenosine dehydratase